MPSRDEDPELANRAFLVVDQTGRAKQQQVFYEPLCRQCHEHGRRHSALPTFMQHYICAHCGWRWTAGHQ
jgi:alkyl hydroperoxide reductase subunit AhpC